MCKVNDYEKEMEYSEPQPIKLTWQDVDEDDGYPD